MLSTFEALWKFVTYYLVKLSWKWQLLSSSLIQKVFIKMKGFFFFCCCNRDLQNNNSLIKIEVYFSNMWKSRWVTQGWHSESVIFRNSKLFYFLKHIASILESSMIMPLFRSAGRKRRGVKVTFFSLMGTTKKLSILHQLPWCWLELRSWPLLTQREMKK